MQVQRFSAAVFGAFELFGYENVARVAQVALFAVLILGLAQLSAASLGMVLAAFAVSHGVAALFLLGCLWRRGGAGAWHLNGPVAKNWLAEAVPLGLGDVVRGLTWQLDTVLLGLLQPAAVVAIYSVAYRPLGPIQWIPLAILSALFPHAAQIGAGDIEGLGRIFSTGVRLLWMIGLPIAVCFCIGAESILIVLAGPDYLGAALPMRILIWLTCLSFMSYPFRYLFLALGQPRAYGWLVVVTFVLKAVVEIVLIPVWGYLGACAGSVLGESVFLLAGATLCGQLGVGTIAWEALGRAALAAAAMGAILWFARGFAAPVLFLAMALTTGFYVVLCIVLGALPWAEVRHLLETVTGSLRPAAARVRV
jgi:O-antigen/teichoic acid export membrane protein